MYVEYISNSRLTVLCVQTLSTIKQTWRVESESFKLQHREGRPELNTHAQWVLPATMLLHITDSHVATIKHHMHYPIFMACTGGAVIFVTSNPYTVWTSVSHQAVLLRTTWLCGWSWLGTSFPLSTSHHWTSVYFQLSHARWTKLTPHMCYIL